MYALEKFFIFLDVSFALAKNCEPGWSHFQGSCYKHIYDDKNRVNYQAASESCASAGAFLATGESEEKMDFLKSTVFYLQILLELAKRKSSFKSTVDAMTLSEDPSLTPASGKFFPASEYPLLGATINRGWSWGHSTNSTYFK